MPVIATRSDMNAVRYHVVFHRSTALSACALALLVVGVVLIASQRSASKDLFDDLFARTVAKRQSIQSIRARFTETTTSTLLDKPLVSRGTLIAAPPGRVLMSYTEPERRTIAIDGRSVVVVWPDRGEREKIDISQIQKRIDQYFAQASISQLRSMFDISAAADPAMRGTDRVDMRPKRQQVKEGLERLELWIDRESLLLVQIRMTFPGGDQKTVKLEDIAVNVPIAEGTFRIDP
jgi:outer membrane lipoprotein-sorting protein